MNKIKGNNVPWRKGKGWVGEVETVGLSGAADRKARKRRKNCVRLHRRGLHQQWIVCVRVCACVCTSCLSFDKSVRLISLWGN